MDYSCLVPGTEELFEIIKTDINGGNYLTNWNWFRENEEIQRNIISILHLKGSDQINVHNSCIGSFNEYEKQDRFINHINGILSNLYDDIYNYCAEKYPEIYKEKEQQDDEDQNDYHCNFIATMKYFENHVTFVTEHVRSVLRYISENKCKFFKALNALWLFEFVIHNFPFIESECQNVLKSLENTCIELRKVKFEKSESVSENQLIHRFKNSTNCLLSLIQGDNYEYVPDTFVYKEFSKVKYLPFKLNFTTKKDFVTKYIRVSLDNIEISPTQIIKILECIKLFEFILEHYDFINSDYFSDQKCRQKFINVISKKCEEFKNDNSVITNTSFEYTVHEYLLDITSFLSDKISVKTFQEKWEESEKTEEGEVEEEEEKEESEDQEIVQEHYKQEEYPTVATTDNHLILINLFLTIGILIHEIYVWHFLK